MYLSPDFPFQEMLRRWNYATRLATDGNGRGTSIVRESSDGPVFWAAHSSPSIKSKRRLESVMQNVSLVRGTTQLSKFHYASLAMPLLALAVLFTWRNQALAQVDSAYVSPKVTPYVFNGDLSKLPPATPSSLRSADRKTILGTFIGGPRPTIGSPDPLWHPGVSGAASSTTLAPGVTPPAFTTPSPNFNTGQPGDEPPDDNGAVGPTTTLRL